MKTKMRDWSGVEVREETRARWIESVREELEKGEESTFLMSGHNMVCGFRQPNGEFEIFDCEVRRIWNSEIEGRKEIEEQAIVENDYDDGIPFLE